jgi:hypothetical protein
MLTASLIISFTCLGAVLNLLFVAGRMPTRLYAGWMAVIYVIGGVVCAVVGWTTVLYLDAGCVALFVWLWWNSGGGDGPRRRLKRWARRFQGVRRTAPQGAS